MIEWSELQQVSLEQRAYHVMSNANESILSLCAANMHQTPVKVSLRNHKSLWMQFHAYNSNWENCRIGNRLWRNWFVGRSCTSLFSSSAVHTRVAIEHIPFNWFSNLVPEHELERRRVSACAVCQTVTSDIVCVLNARVCSMCVSASTLLLLVSVHKTMSWMSQQPNVYDTKFIHRKTICHNRREQKKNKFIGIRMCCVH